MMRVEELVAHAVRLGLQPSQLDLMVHDCAQAEKLDVLNVQEDEQEQDEHVTGVEAEASAINNEGLHAQVEFLLRHNSGEAVRRLLEEAAAR